VAPLRNLALASPIRLAPTRAKAELPSTEVKEDVAEPRKKVPFAGISIRKLQVLLQLNCRILGKSTSPMMERLTITILSHWKLVGRSQSKEINYW
jgi:hypothetical protein